MGPGVPSSGATKASAPVAPGDILAGKYRVERVLGQGGMGVVVAATHIDLLERRAIKFMLASQLADAEAVERFLREARASSRLKGEHVAKVHDVGRLENGAPYLVMEYLIGGDLRVLLKRRGAIPVHEAALYILQACEALAEAHGAGIVHRDMKPENLFLTKRPDGTPSIKVLDFGISKMMGKGGDLAITGTQAILGSPYYMSPEQLRASRDVDPQADVWSLGVILYQLVTNNFPFTGSNLTALITNVISARFVPPSQVRPGVTDALDPVVARCLERDLGRRYPSVAELAEDLLPLAPPIASQSVERINRLLRPNSISPSDRLAYDAPGSPKPAPPESGPQPGSHPHTPGAADEQPTTIVTGASAGGPGATGGAAATGAVAGGADGSVSGVVTGSSVAANTGPNASTLRSGNVGQDLQDATSGSWGNGVQSVHVVVKPSRAPLIILAVGAALSLIIASAAFLLSRTSAGHGDVAISASPSASASSSPSSLSSGHATAVQLPPPVTVTVASDLPPPPLTPPSAESAATTGVITPSSGAPGGTVGKHLFGKLPTKPTSEPARPPPPSGDPFGAGRQ